MNAAGARLMLAVMVGRHALCRGSVLRAGARAVRTGRTRRREQRAERADGEQRECQPRHP